MRGFGEAPWCNQSNWTSEPGWWRSLDLSFGIGCDRPTADLHYGTPSVGTAAMAAFRWTGRECPLAV